MYILGISSAVLVILTLLIWSAGPLVESDTKDTLTSGSKDSEQRRKTPSYHDPEQLPEDIPFRPILVRNEISPRTLQNWLMREQVREGRQYLEDRIHQIGEVRANRIRTWAKHNRVIPSDDAV